MEKLFSSEFWETLLSGAREWIVAELPGLLIIIIVLLIISRIVAFSLNKFKKSLVTRAGKNEKKDAAEVEKRINTL
ncbi:MAG: mechanosensitive ion channel family protein, partial [Tangfeifania sp.]